MTCIQSKIIGLLLLKLTISDNYASCVGIFSRIFIHKLGIEIQLTSTTYKKTLQRKTHWLSNKAV